jgi:hypothetical protein
MILSTALVISLILTVLVNKIIVRRINHDLNWWRQAALELNAEIRRST